MTASSRPSDDGQHWAAWWHEHGPAVRGYLWTLVRRRDAADDLAQEVFFRAWQARDRYREEGAARAYLMRIADHLVCDRARRSQRERPIDDELWRQVEPAGAADPAEGLQRRETHRQLAAALDGLSPAQQRVLLLRYYGELGFAEIAAILGCPLGTALSHCRRGLESLRKTLVKSEP
jgi:RNA polymerase sigma-70 factor (ECF subfamily)